MSHSQSIPKSTDVETLAQAEAIYLSIWNMNCPDCAIYVRDGLILMDGVLRVDVFYEQAVGVIIFTPSMTTPDKLLHVINKIGVDVCHYYWAEIIGRCPAKQALRLA